MPSALTTIATRTLSAAIAGATPEAAATEAVPINCNTVRLFSIFSSCFLHSCRYYRHVHSPALAGFFSTGAGCSRPERPQAGERLLDVAHLQRRRGGQALEGRRLAHAASVDCASGSTTIVWTPASASMA